MGKTYVNNIARKIENIIWEEGRTKQWCANKLNLNYKTFADRIYFNRLTQEDKVNLSKLLEFDLEKLEDEVLQENKRMAG
ncbi:hypothetical protein CPJCM30710_22800 [Clostridium polyendosporum]|uniref:Uncharacterized protein n=1 Tax=Clostridium polyendosporum TaxID=69208 RepID=A0A919S1B2_9CLOT|nr:hypothetical protein [Clostridium polyendosporum]GIM29614.1 hypothetical protein CPJCM30710_22800 [Clostridium polyendosporum]